MQLNKNKGRNCSLRGNEYESQIYNILKRTKINNKVFNTQKKSELGRSSSRYDLSCNYYSFNDVNIEVKKHSTPDWIQCVLKLKYDKENNSWFVPLDQSKLKTKQIFKNIIGNKTLFNLEKPPFVDNKLTYNQWKVIKKQTNIWNDEYFSIPKDTIKKLYLANGYQYIYINQ